MSLVIKDRSEVAVTAYITQALELLDKAAPADSLVKGKDNASVALVICHDDFGPLTIMLYRNTELKTATWEAENGSMRLLSWHAEQFTVMLNAYIQSIYAKLGDRLAEPS